ncbi:MAG: hypothetical protein HKM23_06000 [Nitrosopumilus sp.]|nr:hypothetical protein [Nitrosopumilus sp.]
MKTRLIIISIIVIIVVFSGIVYAISVINEPKTAKDCRFTYGKGGQEMLDCLEKIRDNSSIPSAQKFLNMDCKELEHLFPEFPNKEVADAWITRMHECLNEQEKENEIIELLKNHPLVDEFYAKYPDAREEVRSDHISYFVGSDDGFKVRMNLYFDENNELDYINLKCYLDRELQTDVPGSFISKYLKDFTCDENGSQRNEN